MSNPRYSKADWERIAFLVPFLAKFTDQMTAQDLQSYRELAADYENYRAKRKIA